MKGAPGGAPLIFIVTARLPVAWSSLLPGGGKICAEEAHLSRLWADWRRAAGTLVQQPKEVVASQCHRILRCYFGTAVTMDCFTLPYASPLFHLGIICTLRKSGRRQSTICPCHLGCVCLCWASAPLACCFVVSRLGGTLLAGGSVTRLLFVVVSLLFPWWPILSPNYRSSLN